MSDSLRPARLLRPWDSPGKNTGVGCHALLQRIFLTWGLNLCLLCPLHWQAGSLPLAATWEASLQQHNRSCSSNQKWTAGYVVRLRSPAGDNTEQEKEVPNTHLGASREPGLGSTGLLNRSHRLHGHHSGAGTESLTLCDIGSEGFSHPTGICEAPGIIVQDSA